MLHTSPAVLCPATGFRFDYADCQDVRSCQFYGSHGTTVLGDANPRSKVDLAKLHRTSIHSLCAFRIARPTSELETSARAVTSVSMTCLEEVERDRIIQALEANNWVVGGRNGAAERLGKKRTSLVYRMRKRRIRRAHFQQNGACRDGCPETTGKCDLVRASARRCQCRRSVAASALDRRNHLHLMSRDLARSKALTFLALISKLRFRGLACRVP